MTVIDPSLTGSSRCQGRGTTGDGSAPGPPFGDVAAGATDGAVAVPLAGGGAAARPGGRGRGQLVTPRLQLLAVRGPAAGPERDARAPLDRLELLPGPGRGERGRVLV